MGDRGPTRVATARRAAEVGRPASATASRPTARRRPTDQRASPAKHPPRCLRVLRQRPAGPRAARCAGPDAAGGRPPRTSSAPLAWWKSARPRWQSFGALP